MLTIGLGCSSQKDSPTNRGLQNLSARYNIIYNANVLLSDFQEDLAQTHKDNYDNFLPVYIAPEPIDYLAAANAPADNKSLEEIAKRAQIIIAEKGLSNYIDEANMLLAKTNFYKGNYFTAAAYFDYTAKAYRKTPKTYLDAMTWKSRSLIQLNENAQAVAALDTVKQYLDSVKNGKAEALATLAQVSIFQRDYQDAIEHLTQAIKESNVAQQKIRWSYILAQVFEHQKQYEKSLASYSSVEKSNAPFEMYFNAKLSKIRIDDVLSNQTSNRKEQLLKLLKDDKNIEYTDQIYYEIAEDFLLRQDVEKAKEFYQLSIQKSTRNPYQKGLAYLKLADLNFKSLRNYVDAKLYYDSAANTLPKNYTGYQAIVKKAQNLEYLTTRYERISAQDTLQQLAKLSPQLREQRITEMFTPKAVIVPPTTNLPANSSNNDKNTRTQRNNSTFYFSNLTAVAKGFTDFKRRWGNRPLEDNWRQSIKTSAQINQQSQSTAIGNETVANPTAQQSQTSVDVAKRNAYLETLPLTQEKIQQSNQQIIDAYFDIASFYQQVLEDQSEAIKVYETLLNRYPENNHLVAIYYSLYLGYLNINPQKSEEYKNLVLAKYPNSAYAKTILDPNFSAKQNALEVAVNNNYNEIFALYEKKDFPNVIQSVVQNNQRFPNNSLQSQFDYLKAIAIGRTQNVDTLLLAFDQIIVNHPNDRLITPLVKDHISYINNNLASFKARKIALVDFDFNEPRFIAQREEPTPIPQQAPAAVAAPVQKEQVPPVKIQPTTVTAPVIGKPAQSNIPVQIQLPPKNDTLTKTVVVDNFFSKTESNLYYYVISVADMSISVSSSRFGVGQFNRGNYSGAGLKHQLLELSDDQLIFVGNFESLNDVKTYAEGINTQLTKIMKVPANVYTSFYISKENFDKINNRETLQRYIEFFKNNY